MGLFPISFGYAYILVFIDYVSKWVEAIPCRNNDATGVTKFSKGEHFCKILNSQRDYKRRWDTHFCNRSI